MDEISQGGRPQTHKNCDTQERTFAPWGEDQELGDLVASCALFHGPCEAPPACGPGALRPGFSKSLPLYIFNVNTKTSSDCAEIILIPHLANFTWRKSLQEWAGGRGRGTGWCMLTGQRQKANGRKDLDVCVRSSPYSGAMGNNSDFEIIMAVGKRLYRSVF